MMLESVGTGPAEQSSSLSFTCKANEPCVLLTASVLPPSCIFYNRNNLLLCVRERLLKLPDAFN